MTDEDNISFWKTLALFIAIANGIEAYLTTDIALKISFSGLFLLGLYLHYAWDKKQNRINKK